MAVYKSEFGLSVQVLEIAARQVTVGRAVGWARLPGARDAQGRAGSAAHTSCNCLQPKKGTRPEAACTASPRVLPPEALETGGGFKTSLLQHRAPDIPGVFTVPAACNWEEQLSDRATEKHDMKTQGLSNPKC